MVSAFLVSVSGRVFVSVVVVSGNPGQSQPVNLASAPLSAEPPQKVFLYSRLASWRMLWIRSYTTSSEFHHLPLKMN